VESHGKAAERLVAERVRAALPADAFHIHPNAEWIGPMRDGGLARDGEADLVIASAAADSGLRWFSKSSWRSRPSPRSGRPDGGIR
jgi:hypothetical protein